MHSLRRVLFVTTGGRSEPDSGVPSPDDLIAMLARQYEHRRIALRDDYREALSDNRPADALLLAMVHAHLTAPPPLPLPPPERAWD